MGKKAENQAENHSQQAFEPIPEHTPFKICGKDKGEGVKNHEKEKIRKALSHLWFLFKLQLIKLVIKSLLVKQFFMRSDLFDLSSIQYDYFIRFADR